MPRGNASAGRSTEKDVGDRGSPVPRDKVTPRSSSLVRRMRPSLILVTLLALLCGSCLTACGPPRPDGASSAARQGADNTQRGFDVDEGPAELSVAVKLVEGQVEIRSRRDGAPSLMLLDVWPGEMLNRHAAFARDRERALAKGVREGWTKQLDSERLVFLYPDGATTFMWDVFESTENGQRSFVGGCVEHKDGAEAFCVVRWNSRAVFHELRVVPRRRLREVLDARGAIETAAGEAVAR